METGALPPLAESTCLPVDFRVGTCGAIEVDEGGIAGGPPAEGGGVIPEGCGVPPAFGPSGEEGAGNFPFWFLKSHRYFSYPCLGF